MEDKHLEELEIERGSVKQNIEGDIEHLKKQWEEDHQLDTEALINERERVVAQAEGRLLENIVILSQYL